MHHTDDDEILDLVDENDEVIGTIARQQGYSLKADGGKYLRAVDMFIKNSQGKLWVPTRTADKAIAPNGLDYSCGGHVASGDDYFDTMMREIEEELNFTPDKEKLRCITKLPPDSSPYFRQVFIYDSDETPSYNPQDFVSAEWLSPNELLDKLDSGVAAKSSIRETILWLINHGEL